MSCHLAAHSQIIGRLTFVPQANPSKQEPGQGYRLCNQKMTKSNNKNEGHCRSVVPIINKINHKKILVCIYVLKHNNCMFNPLRHKKLIKNQIKSSKLIYDNTFTNKKPRKNWKISNFDALGWSVWKILIILSKFRDHALVSMMNLTNPWKWGKSRQFTATQSGLGSVNCLRTANEWPFFSLGNDGVKSADCYYLVGGPDWLG